MTKPRLVLGTDSRLLTPKCTVRALASVIDERARQDEKWGQQDHSHKTWMMILQEELGEAARAWLEMSFDKGKSLSYDAQIAALRAELVQCAAVLTAWIETIDRAHEIEAWPPTPERVTR